MNSLHAVLRIDHHSAQVLRFDGEHVDEHFIAHDRMAGIPTPS